MTKEDFNQFKIEHKEARKELTDIIRKDYPVGDHLKMRTALDTLLIMYDNALVELEKLVSYDCKKG